MQTQEAYKQKMAAQLNELDARIKLFEARMENAGADIRLNHAQELQLLRADRREASEKMRELGKAGGNAWKTVIEASDKLWDNLKTDVAKAHARLK